MSKKSTKRESVGEEKHIKDYRVKLKNKFLVDKRKQTENPTARLTDIDKYNGIFKEVSNFESIESFDNSVIEEETLKQLQQKYPYSYAFSTQEPSRRKLSLNERLLEHCLEETSIQKRELIDRKKDTFQTKTPQMCDVASDEGETPRYYRNKREEYLEKISKVRKLTSPMDRAKCVSNEIKMSVVPQNTKNVITEQILDYYKRRKEEIILQKYKTLYRFSRKTHGDQVNFLDRSEPEFLKRLSSLTKEFDVVSDRISCLEDKTNIKHDLVLTEYDFRVYLRNICYKQATSSKINQLLEIIKRSSVNERFNILKKSNEFFEKRKNHSVPFMTVASNEIDVQLYELQDCFDLTNLTNDGGEEFLFTIKKRFNAVFVSQVNSIKFSEYPLHEVCPKNVDQFFMDFVQKERQKISSEESINLSKVYLKTRVDEEFDSSLSEDEHFRIKFTSNRQKKQEVLLNEITKIDKHLKSEIEFLRITDVVYARERINRLVKTHFARAHVKMNDPTNKRRKFAMNIEGGNVTVNKLYAVYMLRYVRIREFRKKLLDTLNYFESIKRRIRLDERGYSLKEELKNGFVAQTFPEEFDLENKEFILQARQIRNRDDMYVKSGNNNLMIKDSNEVFVMYEKAIEELGRRDEFLLKLGSHYINKELSKNNNTLELDFSGDEERNLDFNRNLILEDLYESETWFQDGKRKVVDRYFEAYDHCTNPKLQKKIGEIIYEIILVEPSIDLGANYFSESYASEIIALELQHSFLKDLAESLISDEIEVLTRLKQTKNFNNSEDNCLYGYTETYETSDETSDSKQIRRMRTKVVPNSVPVHFLSFFQSLSKIGSVYTSIKQSVDRIIHTYSIENALIFSTIKRLVYQTAIIEWKLLSGTENIQRRIDYGYSVQRKKFEDNTFLENAETLLDMVDDIYKNKKKSLRIIGQNREPSLGEISTKQLDDHEKREELEKENVKKSFINTNSYEPINEDQEKNGKLSGTKAQLYANVIELVILRNNIISALGKTDLVKDCFYRQKTYLGTDEEDDGTLLSKFKSKENLNLIYEEEQQINFDVDNLKESYSDLEVRKFEKGMSDFDFSSMDKIVELILCGKQLEVMRHCFQFQLSVLRVFEICTIHNQYLLDHYLFDMDKQCLRSEEKTFITNFTQDENINETDLIKCFLDPVIVIEEHIKRIKYDFQQNRENIISSSKIREEKEKEKQKDETESTMDETSEKEIIKSRLIEVKCNLSRSFCHEVQRIFYSDNQKNQIISFLIPLRKLIKNSFSLESDFEKKKAMESRGGEKISKELTNESKKKETDEKNGKTNSSSGRKKSHFSGNGGVYVLGGKNDEVIATLKAYRELGITKPTCIITSDGNLVKNFYIPHFLQVMKMKSLLLDTSRSRELFDTLFMILYLHYCLIVLLNIRKRASKNSVDNILDNNTLLSERKKTEDSKGRNLDDWITDLKKIEAQLDSVQEKHNSFRVIDMMEKIVNVMFSRTFLSLVHLSTRYSLRKNVSFEKTNMFIENEEVSVIESGHATRNGGTVNIKKYEESGNVSNYVNKVVGIIEHEKQNLEMFIGEKECEQLDEFRYDFEWIQPYTERLYGEKKPLLSILKFSDRGKRSSLVRHSQSLGSTTGTEDIVLFLNNLPRSFLVQLNTSQRNFFMANYLALSIDIEDIVNNMYATSTNSEEAVQIMNDYCIDLLREERLKNFFKKKLMEIPSSLSLSKHKMSSFKSSEFSITEKNAKVFEDIYKSLVVREANRLYERVINEYNEKVKEKYLNSTKHHSSTAKMKFKEKNKGELCEKRNFLIKQNLNKLLIVETIHKLKNDIMRLSSFKDDNNGPGSSLSGSKSFSGSRMSVGKKRSSGFLGSKHESSEDNPPVHHPSKLKLFKEFLHSVTKKGVVNKNKSSVTTITMLQKELEESLYHFSVKLYNWKQNEILFGVKSSEKLLNRYKRIAFLYRQRYMNIKRIFLLTKKNFERKVEAEVADKNFDLVFHVASLERENETLVSELQRMKEIAKREVKKEYSDLVRELYSEILKTNTKYSSYKNKFFQDLTGRFNRVKREAILNSTGGKSEKSSERRSSGKSGYDDSRDIFKKAAARLIKEDNHKIRRERRIEEKRLFTKKLKVLHKLRLMAIKGKYEKEIFSLKEEIENNKKSFWGNKAKSEETEQLLRRELTKTQNELSNSQLEIERLKRNLEAQKKNKREFMQWKVKNKQIIDELYKKVQRLEKWNSYNLDIEQLLLEKDNLKSEVEKYSKLKEKMNKQKILIEKRSANKVKQLEKKIKNEKRLKEMAIKRIQNQKVETEFKHFEKKYYDALADKKLLLNEIVIYKQLLQNNKIKIPKFEVTSIQNLRKKEKLPKIYKRPYSATMGQLPINYM